jgi:hypothetical protein
MGLREVTLKAPDGWEFVRDTPALAMPGEYFWSGIPGEPVQQATGFHKLQSWIMEPLNGDAPVLIAGAQEPVPVRALAREGR